jgi:hypothetical protein
VTCSNAGSSSDAPSDTGSEGFLPRRPRRARAELFADAQPHLHARRAVPSATIESHPLEHVVHAVGPSHPLGEVGERLIRRRALPVHEPVREALRSLPQRLEQHRDHDGAATLSVGLPAYPASAPMPATIAT